MTCTFTNDRSVVVPTQPTVTAEICDPNVPGAQLPGSITVPANADYAYFVDGAATAAGTYPKPAGSYKVTAQLIVTKPCIVAAAARCAGRLHLDRGGARLAGLPDPGQDVHPADRMSPRHRSDVSYTITVKNGGDTAVVGETLVDTLPAGVELITSSINPSNGVYDASARTITWKFDLPAASGTTPSAATFTYQVTVTASSGSIVNSGQLGRAGPHGRRPTRWSRRMVGGVEETPDEPDSTGRWDGGPCQHGRWQ